MNAEIGVITNPHSRKNRGRRDRIAELRRIVNARGLVRQTRAVDELGQVLDEFRELGIRYWVSDGGDGTLHWMLNTARERFGDWESVAEHVCCVVPTNGGTIDFVARYAGLHGSAEEILGRLVGLRDEGQGSPRVAVPTVLLRGTLEDANGTQRPFERLGFAAAVAGIASGFFEKYYEIHGGGPRAILEVIAKGATSFLLAGGPLARLTPRRWLDFGRTVRGRIDGKVTVDGVELPYRTLTAFNVGAFPVDLGGVIKVFGKAKDGRLHVTVGEVSDLEAIANLPRIFRGLPLKGRALFDEAACHVHAVASERCFQAVVDGEFISGIRELELVPGPRVSVAQVRT